MTDTEYRRMTATRVGYEWDWEEMDGPGDDADIIEHHFGDALEPRPFAGPGRLVLVRSSGSDVDGVTDRQWAYVQPDGMLPEHFAGSSGEAGSRVPVRYRREFAAMYRRRMTGVANTTPTARAAGSISTIPMIATSATLSATQTRTE